MPDVADRRRTALPIGALFGLWLCRFGIAWTAWGMVLRPPALGWVVSATTWPMTYLMIYRVTRRVMGSADRGVVSPERDRHP